MINLIPQNPKINRGFTLVELLVAIAIMGIMAGMLLYALLGAQNDAKVARTRGTVQKINELVLQKWEEFRYRSVDVRIEPGPQLIPRETARMRMMVLRDWMRMEMPDRITDILYGPTRYTMVYRTGPGGTDFDAAFLDRSIPGGYFAIYSALHNQVESLRASVVHGPKWTNLRLYSPEVAFPGGAVVAAAAVLAPNSSARRSGTDEQWNERVSSSELLYLLVSTLNYGGSSALEHFRPSEIGDVDDDGLVEFVDAWGNAISWLRWPAGYPGDLIRYADDDAMDPIKTDWRYRSSSIPADWRPRTLLPLIFSNGSDGISGIQMDFSVTSPVVYATQTWPTGSSPFGTTTIGAGGVVNNNVHYLHGNYYYPDPFFTQDGLIPAPETHADGFRSNQIGSIHTTFKEFSADNVTNHDLILEP